MKPTDQTKEHVIATYVRPARLKGANVVQVRVGAVQKELGWTNRTPSVFSTLSSKEFQREAGVELIEKRGGPPSGGPSTTVQFVYRILDGSTSEKPSSREFRIIPNGAGLEKLYGILADEFKELGGGEAFLKAERNWGPDAWEKYEQEERARKENQE
ncbi:MAG: hypothetical protein ABSA42_11255 [Terracidiphilus sp.]|jgi:hypothetical protein